MAKGFLDGYPRYDTSNGYGSADEWRKLLTERMSLQQATELMGTNPTQAALQLLGLAPDATPAMIKKAFRDQIKRWHPDKNPDNLVEAAAMTRKIIAAYTILTGQ